jgi:hypothetical protein
VEDEEVEEKVRMFREAVMSVHGWNIKVRTLAKVGNLKLVDVEVDFKDEQERLFAELKYNDYIDAVRKTLHKIIYK